MGASRTMSSSTRGSISGVTSWAAALVVFREEDTGVAGKEAEVVCKDGNAPKSLVALEETGDTGHD